MGLLTSVIEMFAAMAGDRLPVISAIVLEVTPRIIDCATCNIIPVFAVIPTIVSDVLDVFNLSARNVAETKLLVVFDIAALIASLPFNFRTNDEFAVPDVSYVSLLLPSSCSSVSPSSSKT